MISKHSPKEFSRVMSLAIECKPPYDFKKTVQKDTRAGIDWFLFTPFEVYRDGELWTAGRFTLSQTELGLKLRQTGDTRRPSMKIEVFSEKGLSKVEKESVRETLKWCLSTEISLAQFYRLASEYPILKKVTRDLYGMNLTYLPELFGAFLLAITLQMASYGRTEKMLKLLYEKYGQIVEFDGQRLIIGPTPEALSRVSEASLRRGCKLGYRARYIKSGAELFRRNKSLNIEALRKLPLGQAQKILKQLPGIGEYASEIMLPQPAFPVDSWSMKFAMKIFGLRTRDKSKKALERVKAYAQENFKDWQRYVLEYLINDMDKLSQRFGW